MLLVVVGNFAAYHTTGTMWMAQQTAHDCLAQFYWTKDCSETALKSSGSSFVEHPLSWEKFMLPSVSLGALYKFVVSLLSSIWFLGFSWVLGLLVLLALNYISPLESWVVQTLWIVFTDVGCWHPSNMGCHHLECTTEVSSWYDSEHLSESWVWCVWYVHIHRRRLRRRSPKQS
jgi:hypothetical protein